MRPKTNEAVQLYDYQRHVFGAESSPNSANYAKKRARLDREEEYPIVSKAIQNNFFMDDLIKSAENPDVAVEFFNQLQYLPSQKAFERSR